jgi:VCBS repeat-containing protein
VHSQGFQTGNGQVLITTSSGIPSPGPITGSATLCFNGTANYSIASMVGATSYNWTVPPGSTINSGQGTTSINITAGSTSGNISVTATFSCGTSGPSTLMLTIGLVPVIVASSNPASVCSGGTSTLTASGGSTYTWMPGNLTGASVVVAPLITTTYTVTGTNAQGCSNTAMTTVTVIPSPVVTANSTAASVCAGGSVTLTGSGASTYTWDNNVINAVSFVPTATTTYMVTGTDSNGCTNTATITVTVNPLPIVTANSSAASVCAGAGVTLTGGGASTYTWNNNVIDAISFVPTATTTYMVTGTDSNGCVNTATTTVIVNPLPVVTATSSAASVCTGGSVILTGGGASTYTWNNNVMNAFPFIPSATNTYMVTGTDVNGCVNTATVTVTVNGLLVVALGPNIIQCGGSAILNAGNPGSFYLWNNASTTQTISVSASGTYIVVVTDANGCTGSDTALVTINNAPAVTASASSVIVCVDDAVVTLTGTPTGGVWSGPGVTGFTLSPVATGVGLQTAIYSYTDANGCEGIASVNVQVNACVGLAENILANGVSVYPNPNNGSFTLGVNANVGALTIKITDMQGRVVYASVENNVNAGFVKQISLDTQSCGMYLMHIITNGEQQTKKISVQK